MSGRTPLVEYLIKNQTHLTTVDLLREIWMIPDRLVATDRTDVPGGYSFTITTLSPLYAGKLFVYGEMFYAIKDFIRIDDRMGEDKTYRVTGEVTNIKYTSNESKPLCTPQDPFILHKGDIVSYTDDKSTETTIGIFITNYLLLVYPFGDVIPYLNETFTAGKLEKHIAARLLTGEISVDSVKDRYINTLSLIGQANEIICPGISEKTITIPKEITDLRERLIMENRTALKAGDASVMSDIEKQLINAYRKHLEGDPSLHFLLKAKYFNVTLKKLFLTQGMTEVFGQPGKFVFVDNPMGNGWKQKDLSAIFNEVRSGSYSRAIETADGGVIAKLILRVLQDTRIDITDCGTVSGEHVHLSKDALKDFVWNYVIDRDGSTTMITEETLDRFANRDLVVRTPGYCQAPRGYCAKCFGHLFEVLGQKAFAPVANDFARNQTTAALKSMHGKSHSVVDVSDISKYLV